MGSLLIDTDVVEHFRAAGKIRINAILRRTALPRSSA
jgi:uncharacterized protein (DUF4415 family)